RTLAAPGRAGACRPLHGRPRLPRDRGPRHEPSRRGRADVGTGRHVRGAALALDRARQRQRRRARVPVLVQRRAGDSRARPLAGTAPLTTQTLRGCFLTALLVAACAPAMATQISVDPRVGEEVGRGRSRVLVELRLPGGVRPEGEQRQAIARAQDEVLSRLSGTDFTLVRRFASTPYLALEVGPSALAALRTMGGAVEGEAYGNEQGTAAGIGGRQPADAGLAEHREGPRRRLSHGRAYRISFAYWSSSGRTLSRGSGGSRKIERVTPAAAKSSSTFLSGGVANAETVSVFMSRPAFAARALRSFNPSSTFSGARPRGYQPSQKSTTRCNV